MNYLFEAEKVEPDLVQVIRVPDIIDEQFINYLLSKTNIEGPTVENNVLLVEDDYGFDPIKIPAGSFLVLNDYKMIEERYDTLEEFEQDYIPLKHSFDTLEDFENL